jgi:hypothetical protein
MAEKTGQHQKEISLHPNSAIAGFYVPDPDWWTGRKTKTRNRIYR